MPTPERIRRRLKLAEDAKRGRREKRLAEIEKKRQKLRLEHSIIKNEISRLENNISWTEQKIEELYASSRPQAWAHQSTLDGLKKELEWKKRNLGEVQGVLDSMG